MFTNVNDNTVGIDFFYLFQIVVIQFDQGSEPLQYGLDDDTGVAGVETGMIGT